MSPALYLTVARYVVAWGCGLLVQRGWTIANLDGATMDALAQIVVGVIGAVAMGGIGVMTTTVRWTLARLKQHHKPALVAAATEVVVAEPALATRAVSVP